MGIAIFAILVAIATSYMYEQRRKAWVASVKSAARALAVAENSWVYGEGSGGSVTYTNDLDDLYYVGYRWDESVVPHVALATAGTFCAQVQSRNDDSIVWHFSSQVGYIQEGPATAGDCGDALGAGSYAMPAQAARDGMTSTGVQVAWDPASAGGARQGSPYAAPVGDGSSSATSAGSTTSGTTTSGTTTSGTTGSGASGGGASAGGSGGDETGSGSAGGGNGASGNSDRSGDDGDRNGSGTASGGSGGTGTGGKAGSGGGGGTGGGGGKKAGCKKDGKNESDPDGDANGGADKPGGQGGEDKTDQDCNNGSGNDSDHEDDNNGGGNKS